MDTDRWCAEAPASAAELAERLAELARWANRWSEAVAGLREPTRRWAGVAAAASVSLAARRAEEAFLELEVTLGDVRAAGRSLPPAASRGEDGRPTV
ncbi:hypothetical protein [Saccharothrix obliqua]|uniref:hypothetical protein n=1 Tax=Saccharothrix obliqua TaxID=2861747 RepID=UPI001C5E3348|nr:hypothetical protein [Saccharothrix obliqua]MBW4721015.1 hypothetical protein [Saccharothrix obliqua]